MKHTNDEIIAMLYDARELVSKQLHGDEELLHGELEQIQKAIVDARAALDAVQSENAVLWKWANAYFTEIVNEGICYDEQREILDLLTKRAIIDENQDIAKEREIMRAVREAKENQ
jgi:hypothetical protein